jgi:hypothetical protein
MSNSPVRLGYAATLSAAGLFRPGLYTHRRNESTIPPLTNAAVWRRSALAELDAKIAVIIRRSHDPHGLELSGNWSRGQQ